MEHTLHILLRGRDGRPLPPPFGRAARRPGRAWLPYVLLAAATLTRFETAFVAVGIALGDARHRARRAACGRPPRPGGAGLWRWWPCRSPPSPRSRSRTRLMGQGLLPNSVLAKGPRTDARPGPAQTAFNRFGTDPLVAVLTGWRWSPSWPSAAEPGMELPRRRRRRGRAAAHALRPGRLVRALPGLPHRPRRLPRAVPAGRAAGRPARLRPPGGPHRRAGVPAGAVRREQARRGGAGRRRDDRHVRAALPGGAVPPAVLRRGAGGDGRARLHLAVPPGAHHRRVRPRGPRSAPGVGAGERRSGRGPSSGRPWSNGAASTSWSSIR